MSFKPSKPDSCAGPARATMKITAWIHVRQGRIGVSTFMAYALPAMFDMPPNPLAQWQNDPAVVNPQGGVAEVTPVWRIPVVLT
jgi:hypothetical protein